MRRVSIDIPWRIVQSLPLLGMSQQPTITDVARRAGTTTTTVSRVLNDSGYVRASTRAAVLAAIEELHYVPNVNARVLKTKRSRAIGVIIGDLLNPYSAALANSVQSVAAPRGYTTLIASAADEPESELAAIEAFHRQRVAGIIVASLQTPQSDRLLCRLADQRLPLVLVGRSLEHSGVDSVSANYRRGGFLATQHLVDLGHRRIAFVGAQMSDADRIGRFRGYLDGLERAGIPVRPEYVVGNHRMEPSPRYSTQLTGYQGAQEILRLRSRPTAIFARNDHTAIAALQALKEAGLRIPEDVSIAGFDNIPLSAAISPALTTVSQPTDEEGRLAAEYLLGRVERPAEEAGRRELVLECNLIVRASTGPPKAGVTRLVPKAADGTAAATADEGARRAE
jgi:DNA-binding LacI/PurR family transcriptional regulator